jgi:hypothetical protein
MFIPEYLPAMDFLKLALLSKTFKKKIDELIYPLTYADLKRFTQVMNCTQCLNTVPDVSKFKQLAMIKEGGDSRVRNTEMRFFKNLEDALSNDLYGGSVFTGI